MSLNKGSATVTLKPGNLVTIEQLQRAITKNGFTTKQSTVEVTGTLLAQSSKLMLRVSGSNEQFNLVPQTAQPQPPDLNSLSGKTVTVEGMIPDVPKGQTPDTIQFRSIIGG